jgi:hypothetical protein
MEMHFLTPKKSSLLTLLLATSYIIGDETPPASQKKDTTAQMMAGYSAPCCINVDQSYDFFLSGSFIYWQPKQENMELGIVSNLTDSDDIVNGKYVDLNFDYKPGFKVGLGMNFDCDKWDTFLEYTWFRAKETVRKNLNPNNTEISLIPSWQFPAFLNPTYSSGSEKWKLRMDLFDWDLARNSHVGKKLCLRPFIGLRGAIINQKIKVDYINKTAAALLISPSTSVYQKSHSWGIGPRFGIDSNWNLGAGFRLFGNGEFDILCTRYDLKTVQEAIDSDESTFSLKQNNISYLRTHADFELGFGWGSYFAKNKWHIDLAAGYGFQVFFNQNMFRTVLSTDVISKSIVPNGNLYIQGLTATARLDF